MDDTKRLIASEMPRLRGYARRLEADPDSAEDLLQDGLERAIRKRHLWSGRGSLRSWLYRVLFSVFANRRLRRIRERAEVPLEDGPVVPVPPQQEQRLICGDIIRAVDDLPREQRVAVTIGADAEISCNEAARKAGMPIGTFKSRQSRGRERLRQALSAEARGVAS